MKRTWILASMAVVVLSLFAGVTLALLSDSKSAQGDLVAGTVDIDGQRDNGDTIPGPMFYVDETLGNQPDGWVGGQFQGWAPGDRIHKVLQVENVGTLDAWLKTVKATLDSGDPALASKLHVTVSTDPDGNNVVASGALSDFYTAKAFTPVIRADAAHPDDPINPTFAGDLIDLHFFVSLPLNADNAYQNLTAEVSFAVYAEQVRNNP